jgi:hypothetical protein
MAIIIHYHRKYTLQGHYFKKKLPKMICPLKNFHSECTDRATFFGGRREEVIFAKGRKVVI